MTAYPTILISTDTIGGVWTYSLALARGFVSRNHRVVLLVLGPPPNAAQQEEVLEIPGCTMAESGLGLDWTAQNPSDLAELAEHLAALAGMHGVTSAHLHAPCLAAAPWRVPVVAVAHSCMATWWSSMRVGIPSPEFAWHAAATRAGLDQADVVIAPSQSFAKDLERVYGARSPIHVIYNGADPAAATVGTRRAFVLSAGRLWDEGKNISTLDRAGARMRTPIYVAGPVAGPRGASFTARNVRLFGTLPGAVLRATMAQAAIFAAPSLYEPFGLAVLEAAQTGAPLVLADIPTFRELWENAAILVPARDDAIWAETLDALAADPARRAALGEAARRRACLYTQTRMVDATIAIHTRLAARAQKAA